MPFWILATDYWLLDSSTSVLADYFSSFFSSRAQTDGSGFLFMSDT